MFRKPRLQALPRSNPPMFRKPRLQTLPRSTPGETPSSPTAPAESSDRPHLLPDPITTGSSPPSAKKQKFSYQTPSKPAPAKPTPGKQKQGLITQFTRKTPFGPQSTGKSKGKNALISSFFKPVTPGTDGKGAGGKDEKKGGLKGTQGDELFVRHGEYELEVSDPEDAEEEDESGGWATGRSLSGKLQLAKQQDTKEEELFSSPIETKSRFWGLPADTEEISDEVETVDGKDDMVMGREVDEIESVASTSPTDIPNPVTPAHKPTIGLKFNPESLNLDNSRSILFAKKGSTPSPFKKLKNAKTRSSSSSSAEEVGFLDKDDEDIILEDERSNRSIGEFMVEKKVDVEKESNKAKRTRDQAFKNDPTKPLSDTLVEKEKSRKPESEEIDNDLSSKIEERLEECNLESKHLHKREGSGFDDDFEDIEDFPDDEIGFEEQEELYSFDPSNRAEAGYEDFDGDFEFFENPIKHDDIESTPHPEDSVKCPICAAAIGALSEQDANNHVNHCLDGTPIPVPTSPKKPPANSSSSLTSPFFSRASVISPPSKSSAGKPSAFARLMSTNTEAQAWASAAKAEVDSRGKRATERKCPFYKILFDGSITVDAFHYGAIPGCKAYFLSHFHSDHYIGLTPKWDHGPIWCSRATGNLVKRKLGVDPKYVRELPWEDWTTFEVPGIRVRGLDANHCPGSMLFLFEKAKQRVLHCGDFRASPRHLKHPLLTPGKDGVKGQRIDVVYLDTTYLNPKYAFPSQKSVIDTCSTMCVSLQKEAGDGFVSSIAVKKGAMSSFKSTTTAIVKKGGRLLVVVGTYSIGKERVCIGIAKALNSKIFAPPNKMKVCTCLEDPDLDALLTSDPHEAQVHMTPLRDIGAETLQEYLNTFKPHFDRIVGFRPTGWNYRPPNSRFTESPAVSTVLHSSGWRSEYSLNELVPQRGSTRTAKLFGVPYSEHSSFRELSMFCCGLNIGKVIPTVNIGSVASRDKMKIWFERWETEKRKNGLFGVDEGDGKGGVW